MTTVKFLTEFEVKEIAYRTSYLMINGWKRYSVTYDLLEKERPDLQYEEKDHIWIKEMTEFVGTNFECHVIDYNFTSEKKVSHYFTLNEAYHHQMKKSLSEPNSSVVMD